MIYFIESNNYLKVGYTSNITNRMKQYATHNPDFHLLYVIEGDEKLEKEIHRELKDYHYRLEWFYIDDYVRYQIEYIREKYKHWVEDEVSVRAKQKGKEDALIEHLLETVKEPRSFPITKYFISKWAKAIKTAAKNIQPMINKLVKSEVMFVVANGVYGININKVNNEEGE